MTSPVEVSIIIPTLRERESLSALLPRLFSVLNAANLSAEILIVDDDSRDGSEELCEKLAQTHSLRFVTRHGERGLATAVLKGLHESAGEICVVMDADGSHPPEAVPELVDAARSPFCDVAIGSRYVRGGSADEKWSFARRINSFGATLLARGLTRAADPMAGFFAIRQAKIAQAHTLKPLGYKILLELIVRCNCRRIVEVPIHFQDRALGQSKLSTAQMWLYLRHLSRLYAARYLPARGSRSPSAGPQPPREFPQRKSA
jgi:dolichol-phosphate mannosyltransferase